MKELGILVPIVTPCDREGNIDYDSLKAVCDDMTEAGCSNIFAAGSTGRGPWFPVEDKAAVCRTIAGHTGKKAKVFAGCMASGISEMLRNAHAMADAGADIAVVTAPAYFNYDHSEVEKIFTAFADKSPLPVLIYDIPVFTGMKLDKDMVLRLSGHGNVAGFKDSSSDIARFRELAGALCEKPDFILLQGKEHLLLDSLLAGASGFVVGLLHVDPRPFAALYDAAVSGDLKTAAAIQGGIKQVMDLAVSCIEKRPAVSTLFHFLNRCLIERGVCGNIMMDFEGECPGFVFDNAREAVRICAEMI